MLSTTADRVKVLAADCGAMVRVASPEDWPGGFVVIPERLPGTMRGCAIGAGAGLAELYRCRPGTHAVLLDVARCVADLEAPRLAELAVVEAIALHEAAHSLTSPDTTAERVAELLANARVDVPAYSPERVARQHAPTWAMALWLLTSRVLAYRPGRRDTLRHLVVADVQRYGYPADELERLAAGVAVDVPLRGQLVAGGAWDTLVSMRLPTEEQRATAIVAAGISRGERRELPLEGGTT